MGPGDFFYHYDSATHKGKLVTITHSGEVLEELVDKIICAVHTVTERQEVSPKFVVKGKCNSIVLTRSEDGKELTAYISNQQ